MPSPGLQSFVGSWYSVVAYGAGGAGNTNDTTAIQAAMTAANGNGGGTVVVPAGTYRLDSSLSWTGLTNVCLWLGTGASFTGVGTVTAASGTNNSIFDQRTSGGGGGVGTVTSVSGTSPISVATGTTTPAISFDGTAALSQSNTITGTAVGASGLTGAANPVRIVGRNASGAPTTGTFQVGDVVVNTDGTEYVCSVAGTPGTWVQIGGLSYGTPVNIDASVTSLSAGSLTTVARADHVHTVSNAMTFIGRVTLSVDATSLTAINVPQTFNNLMMIVESKTTWTGATDTIALRFNGLSTSVYGSTYSTTATTQIEFGTQATFASTTALAGGTMFIYNYADTTKHKRVSLNNSYYITNFTDGYNYFAQASFLSNSAITSVQLLCLSGQSLKAGSRVTIYGMP